MYFTICIRNAVSYLFLLIYSPFSLSHLHVTLPLIRIVSKVYQQIVLALSKEIYDRRNIYDQIILYVQIHRKSIHIFLFKYKFEKYSMPVNTPIPYDYFRSFCCGLK